MKWGGINNFDFVQILLMKWRQITRSVPYRRVRQSKFIIADLTNNKKGVYFEAGFARGLGREVIFTCQSEHFSNRHFDVQHLNFLKWDKTKLDEAKVNLTSRIIATMDRGTFMK